MDDFIMDFLVGNIIGESNPDVVVELSSSTSTPRSDSCGFGGSLDGDNDDDDDDDDDDAVIALPLCSLVVARTLIGIDVLAGE
jgi:hypothetical protein